VVAVRNLVVRVQVERVDKEWMVDGEMKVETVVVEVEEHLKQVETGTLRMVKEVMDWVTRCEQIQMFNTQVVEVLVTVVLLMVELVVVVAVPLLVLLTQVVVEVLTALIINQEQTAVLVL
tara:strand:+ start:237 stop:596 length:360 start_codon:yes stop_codon:yes gene_type:complete